MKKSKAYQADLIESLRDAREAEGYLNAALEEDDPELFLLALRNVAEAQGGVASLAEKTKLNRESLYRMLSERGNPGALRATTDASGRYTIRALSARTYDPFVVEMKDGKPTGVVGAPGTAHVVVKTNRDAIAGVRLIVRRANADRVR